jgi:sugar phosphate permease
MIRFIFLMSDRIRYVVLLVLITALAAFWLYIDRVCFSTLADPIQKDLALTDYQKGYILSAFFFTYALFQIPLGTLADRFGPRLVLALSIVAWSLVTASTALVSGFVGLVLVRLLLGITESGAYPAAAALIKRWAPVSVRGVCSSVVALGGRIGGAVAPFLTAWLAVTLVGFGWPGWSEGESGVNWRGVFVVYGACGVLVAMVYWIVVRDHPPTPPLTNSQASRREPSDSETARAYREAPQSHRPAILPQLARLATSRNMWLFGTMQFCVNIGWVFVITLMPTYLNEAYAVPLQQRGSMQSVVLFIGVAGMLFGGIFTDLLRLWLGARWGRSVPLVLTLGGCSAALWAIPAFSSVWLVVAALSLMTFLVDLHNPTVWSFAQDVGGRTVGMALGWGNMWGNIGAALSPVILTVLRTHAGWNTAFLVCGSSFALAAVCGTLLDATKPVDPESTEPALPPTAR